jgi:hypothetical protein
MARMTRKQLSLPLGLLNNSELFSNHWLAKRLPLEPEWTESRARATQALEELLALWKTQQARVPQYGSEQALEEAFIQPVLKTLGWKLIYQTYLRGRKPDYALFANDESLDAALAATRLSPDFWKYPSIVADAKGWSVPLDRPLAVGNIREYPPEQIEWYLNNSLVDYGLLTNGRYWRLVPRNHDPGQPRFQTYCECDLTQILSDRLKEPRTLFDESHALEEFFRFYLLFSPLAFVPLADRVPLISRARRGSTEYRLGVGEGLKQRVFDALRLSIEGFLSYDPNRLSPSVDLQTVRQNSFVLLYRLLFILFAEDRKLLPYHVDRAYTDNRSLGRFRDEISSRLDYIEEGCETEYPSQSCALWDDLLTLFDLIDRGAARYSVPAYNGGLFDSATHTFLSVNRMPDGYLARVIDQLARALDPAHPAGGLVRVDYRDLAIQHLGNVYEGLLELQPHFAKVDMIVVNNAADDEERGIPERAPIPRGFVPAGMSYKKGAVYLLTEKGERRASGSYYTPNDIVDDIVESTLGPICEEIDRTLRLEITTTEREIVTSAGMERETNSQNPQDPRAKFDVRVLGLRILDPAMGSGHFLLRACQYLAEQIATNPNTRDPIAENLQGDESTLTYWKRQVVEMCLYGVDRNPLAVELAKLALWLETVAVGHPLTFLDYHLRNGDSLIGASLDVLHGIPNAPPLMTNHFKEELHAGLPTLFQALEAIQTTPSNTVQQVKEKDKLLRERLEPARESFRRVADLWYSTFFAPADARLSLVDYHKAASKLKTPQALRRLLDQSPYREGLQALGTNGVIPFHWELEFPEVFFDSQQQRPNRGFDAILGNPPYDVLSEKEIGRDLSRVKEFYRYWPLYKPSFVGKNNLYKLFACRALDLLAEPGRLGFITPMPILGDEQASGVRKEILRLGAFAKIEVFPQKDSPAKRVFPDAKLSTAIVIVHKTEAPDAKATPFTLRIHPENKIDTNAPTLRLTSMDIPLYDPENMTITSCSQADWDLAVRIMQSGRMERLGALCIQYQGEVNETNEKPRGALSDQPPGPLVLRGANVCLYALRVASQGENLYLSERSFLEGKATDSKAYAHRHDRIGFQRSSPQNNFRRIIACPVPRGQYCFDTISYVPENETSISPLMLLGLLNSKLLDWYFRLGSTNSKVNEYQFNILPCPRFSRRHAESDSAMSRDSLSALRKNRLSDIPGILAAAFSEPPFGAAIADTIISAVRSISSIESSREHISRHERSQLSPEAQPYQDLIDALLYKMAGLTEDEQEGLEQRLAQML